MSDDTLLRELIHDAADRPRVLTAPPPVGGRVLAVIERTNPTCGDRCALTLWQVGEVVALRGETTGCQLSRAAAELLAARVEGTSAAEALALASSAAAIRMGTRVQDALHGDTVDDDDDVLLLATAEIAPLRRRCVALAWNGVAAAQHPDA
ncbi:iron-sulfur cluster assembly scaffold protein [Microbacterium esteraromaticum]|nr:iron-sulfur cluster assembly scaffold protein [Microbacterium esteraromaticum]